MLIREPGAMPRIRRLAGAGLDEGGFSLVEVLVVVIIIGVVLALGMPSFQAWIENTKVRAAAESYLTGIQLARTEAVRRNAPVSFSRNPSPDVLWRVGCVTPAAECPAVISERALGEGKMNNSILSVTSDGGNTLVFDSFGRRRTTTSIPPNADDFGRLDIAHSTLSADDNRPQRILIGTGGTVRMCDPKLVAPNLRACP